MDDVLDMIDWASDITVGTPKKSNINSNIPTTRQVIQHKKHVFLTTHNPLVLDGLDLRNDDVRLFAVDRDSHGYAQIKRIFVSQELIDEGQPLSRLWINGRLGGVPTLI